MNIVHLLDKEYLNMVHIVNEILYILLKKMK